ncbi:vWA domain-containing protein [Paenibacillus soyae]|uniref:VWA domain-containing protein n=1 Tax=Paenibacillus soyae TaxID=2969249 RepID=A0A9X2MSN3_9BACL|nr:VWA domain-containing protein [Paenibacillus soyae]MCR2805499.1 VWA domain-containing protein [Paenibacillus soyae]
MQFLSAASAWFAAALPLIALMYLLKRTYRETEVASHLLWRRLLQEQEANRPWQRLRGRLLLLLQLLAALLLVLALMEPAALRPAGSKGHAVLVMDRSGSMAEVSAEAAGAERSTRFEEAVQAAKQWIAQQPGGRPISLIASGAEPMELASAETDHESIIRLLDEIRPFYGNTDNAAALSLADSLHLGEEDGITLLFTDGRWRDAEEANQLALNAAAEIRRIGAEDRPDNGSIIQMGIASDSSDNHLLHATVTVQNNGSGEKTFTVRLLAVQEDGSSEAARELQLAVPPGEWRSAEASGLPPADYYKAQLLPAVDGVSADNLAYGFPAVRQSSRTLLVTEGNLFLEKALMLAGVQPVKIHPDAAAPSEESAQAIDWIVVDGNYERLSQDAGWEKLLSGKPLWLIDHPENEAPTTAVPKHAAVEAAEHPVTSYITLQDTHIGKLHVPLSDEVDWGAPILTFGEIPAIFAGSEQGRPRLRYTFNLQDTDLPLRPEFPVLIVQSAEWMSGGSLGDLGVVQAGGAVEIPFRSETARAEWEAVELLDAGVGAAGTTAKQNLPAIDLTASSQEAPSIPGLYRLLETGSDGEMAGSRYLAVKPDYAEFASGQGDEGLLTLQYRSDGGDAAAPDNDSGAPLVQEPLLLWAVLAVLLVMLMEWEVYRRGHAG